MGINRIKKMKIKKRKVKGNLNKEKMKETLLYICQRCSSLPHFGKTVLYKLLYFCDFDFYEKYEKFLIGESYRKIEKGPAPVHYDMIIKELKGEGRIKILQTKYYELSQEKPIPLIEPDLSKLSAQELDLINDEIDRLSKMNATQISEYSHKDLPFEATKGKEILNYELVFYRSPEYSVREYPPE